jgi:GNAT superfamily N-acetyltransferase
MKSPIDIAIANFVDHCQAIPSSLGSPGSQTTAFSTNQHTLNIPYPNGITIGQTDNQDSQMSQIRQMIAGRPSGAVTSMVDSFSSLDLTPLGFHTLFDTPWTFRHASPVESLPIRQPQFRIETVNTPAQLQEFDRAAAAGFGQPDDDTVYSTPLLTDPRYDFYFIRQSNKIAAGVQTFTNNESIGVYTLFTLPEHRRKGFAKSLVNHVLSLTPDLPAVTNPSEDSDHLFRNAGFSHIGTRTIWLHVPS